MYSKNKDKLSPFISNKIRFIAEQIGVYENEFKRELITVFIEQQKNMRAYLARLEYGSVKDFNVALCIRLEIDEDVTLAREAASIFSRMFGRDEHLDILFLSNDQEKELRNICCPFFTTEGYEYDTPDFYLTSREGYGLEPIRSCFKLKRFLGNHPDGYMLCKIDPCIIGQQFGLGGNDINKIILARRHEGSSIFTIKKWPVSVHVARILKSNVENQFSIEKSDIELIGWGEIYEHRNLE